MAGGRRETDFDEGEAFPSIWDEADDEAGRDWPEDDAAPLPPAPEAPVRAWLAAEAQQGAGLAAAAAALARVDERLRAWPDDHRRAGAERLALTQAAHLLWAEGAVIGPERLALDGMMRAGRAGEDAADLARGVWAARRLVAARWSLGSAAAVARFEERVPVADDGEGGNPGEEPAAETVRGGAWVAAAEDWAAGVAALRGAHPFTQAAFAELAWRRLGLAQPGAVTTPAVLAMKIAARTCRGGIAFAPLPRLRRPAGPEPEARLAAWLRDIAEGAAEALITLERMQIWRARAEAAIDDLSGRTPRRLVAALAARYAVAAPEAARACDVSVSAAQRNFATLTGRGLAREITGQGRFRVWTAAL